MLDNEKQLLGATCSVGAAAPYSDQPDFQITGCGTFISENELVTCWHVLRMDNGQQVPDKLILIKNQDGEYSRVERLIVDPDKDLAYIRLASPIGKNHVSLHENGPSFDLKDKFQLLSCYKGKADIDHSLLKTAFTKKAKFKGTEKGGSYNVYLTTQNIRKGYSGSGVLANGNICSVLSIKSLEFQGEVWAPTVSNFSDFVVRARKKAPLPVKKKSGLQNLLGLFKI